VLATESSTSTNIGATSSPPAICQEHSQHGAQGIVHFEAADSWRRTGFYKSQLPGSNASLLLYLQESKNILLDTIRIPRNLNSLKSKLPKSKYEEHNQSYEFLPQKEYNHFGISKKPSPSALIRKKL
jgi:hypothetical protein